MIQTKYLIIGGGVAGTTAAETIRHHDRDGSITLVTDEKERLYSRVLLPHFLRGTTEYDRIFLKKETFYKDNNIDFYPSTVVKELDTTGKIVTTQKGEQFQYEKLLIATGGKLIPWDLNGGQKGIVYLRTANHATQIKELVGSAKAAVVVGGGFIALELVSIFIKNSLKTTLIVREPYFFQKFLDEEGGRLVQTILEKHGAEVIVSEEIRKIVGVGQVEQVITQSGREIDCQIVGVGIGIQPQLRFLDQTPIQHDPFIETNDKFEVAGVEGVWAAGDVTFFPSRLIGNRRINLQNWANAVEQGRLAATGMVGSTEPRLIPLSTTYSINFFDSSMSAVGVTNPHFADQVIGRGSLTEGKMGRIFKKEGRIIGALLIGLPADRGSVMKLLDTPIGNSFDERIKDLSFSLETIKPDA